MQKEIEVKFKIDEINDIKDQLINLGASFEESYEQTAYGFFPKIQLRKVYFPESETRKMMLS